MLESKTEEDGSSDVQKHEPSFYRVQYRIDGQHLTASAEIAGLDAGTVVMVQSDHDLEPGRITGNAPMCGCREEERRAAHSIKRCASDHEIEKYQKLATDEEQAFLTCLSLIQKHKLSMHLVRVEKFFNGSKMIFYFTADSRVDFRALVKDLVQEFRTRVEMRQVGVRHETKMLGGIGTCGRELCCSSFIKKFDSVSIKMAKEQDLPLNPTKISGVCNRLLCCLTYEYDAYRKQRKNMPKPGKRLSIGDEQYLVRRQMVLQGTVVAQKSTGEEVTLTKDEWGAGKPVKKPPTEKRGKKN